MNFRSILVAAVATASLVLSFGLFAAPAGAASANTSVVNDAATNTPWSNAETFGATAYDTAVVTPDVASPAGGTLMYQLFPNGSCNGSAITTQPVTLNSDGSVPNSATTAALDAGVYSFDATYLGDGTNTPSPGTCSSQFIINAATPTTPTIANVPTSATWGPGGGFTASVSTDSDGAQSVTSSTTSVCTSSGLGVAYVSAGLCTLTAHTATSNNFLPAAGPQQSFTIAQAGATAPVIANIPTNATWGSAPGFTATLSGTNSDGARSVTSSTTSVCTASGLVVTYVSAGSCTLSAQTAASTNFAAASGTPQSFAIAQETPTVPSITNAPTNPTWSQNGGFIATLSTNSDGAQSVTSSTTSVCITNGLDVLYVNAGQCTLTAQTAASTNFPASSGTPRTFTIGQATPTTPTITNVPSPAKEFFGFTVIVGTTGDGTASVTSNTPNVCSVDTNGLTVTFVGFGTCSLTPHVGQGTNYFAATGTAQTFFVQEASHGYWLVGSDGGIFSFGSAAFHGSTGSTPLQRPVVAITPTSTGNGYWLVASDGGIFSFGDSTFYGSLPGIGFHPNGSGLPKSLNAPIVGMVPTFTGHGYFMVASDGGVFAFGDAKFEGSCPGIGGCTGSAVAVMPDRTGNGYWLVTNLGAVYAFGDAKYYGSPAPASVRVVDAVATSNGQGYWLLYANGVVANFGDATNFGAPVGYVNGFNPATTIFPTADNQGYWVASARGDVFCYGDSPYLGSMAASGLNGEVIGAFGF